jgi:hypothetical protein
MDEQQKNESLSPSQEKREPEEAAAPGKSQLLSGVVTIKKLHLFLAAMSIAAAILMFLSFSIDVSPLKELMFEFGKAVIIGVFITGTLNRVIANQRKEEEKKNQDEVVAQFKKRIDGITGNLSAQTAKMQDVTASFETMKNTAESFEAMIHTGIRRIYKSRGEIAKTVGERFEKDHTIYICGVSLNDFLRDEHPEFFEMWNDELLKRLDNNDDLNVKILIINPDSRGAIHRKKAESVDMRWGNKEGEAVEINDIHNPEKGRLAVDVGSAISDLINIVDKYRGKIEVHLYNCDPIMFLIWTERASFVQQYLFRPTHKNYDSIPVAEYGDVEHANFKSYHRELKFHFEWIWNYYSTDIAEYVCNKSIGIDRGIIGAGIKNVYYDYGVCKDRMKSLINSTRGMLWIRGVSLRSFFMPEEDLYDALRKKYIGADSDFEMRIILIDMEAESAKKRAFREYEISGGTDDYKVFVNQGAYDGQKLYVDTRQTLKYIGQFKRECDRAVAGQRQNKRIELRVSQEDPEGFFFFTDKSVLVEQYHFGKLKQDDIAAQKLGGEVPVFEFEDTDRAKQYKLYKDHFDYLFRISKEPPQQTK